MHSSFLHYIVCVIFYFEIIISLFFLIPFNFDFQKIYLHCLLFRYWNHPVHFDLLSLGYLWVVIHSFFSEFTNHLHLLENMCIILKSDQYTFLYRFSKIHQYWNNFYCNYLYFLRMFLLEFNFYSNFFHHFLSHFKVK